MTTFFSSHSELLLTQHGRFFERGGAKSIHYCISGARHSSRQKASEHALPESKSKLIPGEEIKGQEMGRLKARSGMTIFISGF